MKKLVLTMLVVALAIPAMAADISITADGVIQLTSVAGENVRGLAIVVESENPITGITAVNTAEFNVNMDAAFEATTYNIGDGLELAANPDGAGTIALGGTKISICLGKLDETGGQAAISAGTINVATIATSGMVTITADTLRGGIVGDAVVAGTIEGGLVGGDEPCVGDVNKSGVINTVDLTVLVQLLVDNKTIVDGPFGPVTKYEISSTDAAYFPEADVNSNGTINTVDLTVLVQYLVDNKTIVDGPFGPVTKYEVACD